MSIDLKPLANIRRLLFEVALQPMQGKRFQPTGFPDLGAATYQAGGTACLLVESAQSMANRLEETLWDSGKQSPVNAANGISYVVVKDDSGDYLTSSITESHRLNSPYILESSDKTFVDALKKELGVQESGPIDRTAFTKALMKFDINALLHGVFLAKKDLAGGRLRLARAISSFVEAENIATAASGGVKNDHVDPSGDTAKGFGNVPFHREEFTAEKITAFFSVDLQQIRSYGLGDDPTHLLIVLALFKIRSLLDGDMRLRTACDFKPVSEKIVARNPGGYELPAMDALSIELKAAIVNCKANMTVTTVTYKK
ncbi:MAG: type I-U CRISPR-associated RAMP protein Csb1/Cas7u [Pirellula sp.]